MSEVRRVRWNKTDGVAKRRRQHTSRPIAPITVLGRRAVRRVACQHVAPGRSTDKEKETRQGGKKRREKIRRTGVAERASRGGRRNEKKKKRPKKQAERKKKGTTAKRRRNSSHSREENEPTVCAPAESGAYFCTRRSPSRSLGRPGRARRGWRTLAHRERERDTGRKYSITSTNTVWTEKFNGNCIK